MTRVGEKGRDSGEPRVVVGSSPAQGPQEESLLRGLRLTADDLETLRRRGSVHLERRGKQIIGKLRFRRQGRQYVRYLGGEDTARRFQEELTRWQAASRKARQLVGLAKAARAALRASKQTLAPYLEPNGYRFHGLAMRRRRDASQKAADALRPEHGLAKQ